MVIQKNPTSVYRGSGRVKYPRNYQHETMVIEGIMWKSTCSAGARFVNELEGNLQLNTMRG